MKISERNLLIGSSSGGILAASISIISYRIYIINLTNYYLSKEEFETLMINRLIKLALEFVDKYKSEGPSLLVNCHQKQEFQTLLDHVKGINSSHLGIQTNNMSKYFESSSVSYFNIIEEQDISIGVFCLAQGT